MTMYRSFDIAVNQRIDGLDVRDLHPEGIVRFSCGTFKEATQWVDAWHANQLRVPRGAVFVADGNRPEDVSGAQGLPHMPTLQEFQDMTTAQMYDLLYAQWHEQAHQTLAMGRRVAKVETELQNLKDDEIDTLDSTMGEFAHRLTRLQDHDTDHSRRLHNVTDGLIRVLRILARAGNGDAQDILKALES